MSETMSRSRRRSSTASSSLNNIIGPMVIVMGIVLGLIYWQQVSVESRLIKRNQAIIACQDQWNDIFAETIQARFDLSTRRKDSLAKLMTGVGKVIEEALQSSKQQGNTRQEYALYHKLFAQFAKEEAEFKKLRAASQLPEYPECYDVKAKEVEARR